MKTKLILLFFAIYSSFLPADDSVLDLTYGVETQLIRISKMEKTGDEAKALFKELRIARNKLFEASPSRGMDVLIKLLENNINSKEKILYYLSNNSNVELDIKFNVVLNKNIQLEKICIPRKRTEIDIYFINGMFNSADYAAFSLSELKRMQNSLQDSVKKIEGFSPKINFIPLVNESENVIYQLAQVTLHKMKDNFGSFWQYVYKLEKAPESFKKDYFDLIVSQIKSKNFSIPNDQLGNAFYVKVKGSIENGNVPIIISHSQGNFYANYISRKLLASSVNDDVNKYFGNIQIASPTWFNASEAGVSFLRSDDIVIAKAVDLLSMSSDVTHEGRPSVESTGHGFVNSYLNDSVIRKEFIRSFGLIFNNLITKGYFDNHARIEIIKENPANQNCDLLDFIEHKKDPDNCVGSGNMSCHCILEGEYNAKVSLHKFSKDVCGTSIRFETPTSETQLSFKKEGDGDSVTDFNIKLNVVFKDKGLIFEAKKDD